MVACLVIFSVDMKVERRDNLMALKRVEKMDSLVWK